ncbi:hypothetical protein GMORB2_3986 [Geosmithia morbida]|uniref:Uncharacterized protein n=1 Tax=Geosmithia morbida TaxID=1094350 RepID=A0A9P5D3N7_9HYPO|nr:uncharacterized protein GMORB2_3986 [Geosmithia morbida]KAF4125147.1 hypothetical protein GMORB2_3986 [Geosmithia morbida]
MKLPLLASSALWALTANAADDDILKHVDPLVGSVNGAYYDD